MNSPVNIGGVAGQGSGIIGKLQGMQTPLFRILKLSGIILAIGGLQAYAFNNHFLPRINQANQHLDRLAAEISTNDQVDIVLSRLADLRRTTTNESLQTEIVQTYERFVGEFLENPNSAIADFARVVNIFTVEPDTLEHEILVNLKQEMLHLESLYADNYSDLNTEFESPPFYMQPTAALIKRDGELARNISFNHALYLSLTADRSAANTIFNELKSDSVDPAFMSLVHYAQARMLYDAFVAQNNMDYYQQAIQNLQDSLRKDPGYGMPKLFLEYLLSMERGAQAEDVPQQGEGTGEAEGERGVLSSHPPTF